MDGDLTKLLIELVVIIVAFLVGRYVMPKIKTDIKDASAQFTFLLNYAESFCSYAKQFINGSGSEKMDTVVEKLKVICDKYGIEVDEETLRAIAQKAYDAMVNGEKTSGVLLESAISEIIPNATEDVATALLNNVEEAIDAIEDTNE